MQAFLSGAWRSVSSGQAYISGAWRNLATGKGYISGTWRDAVTFVPPMTLSAPDFGGAANGTSVSAVASSTPSGGLAPYTYSWTLLSSSGGTFSISSATSANCLVTATGVSIATPAVCTVRCTATDSAGATASADAQGTLTNEGQFGGGGKVSTF